MPKNYFFIEFNNFEIFYHFEQLFINFIKNLYTITLTSKLLL